MLFYTTTETDGQSDCPIHIRKLFFDTCKWSHYFEYAVNSCYISVELKPKFYQIWISKGKNQRRVEPIAKCPAISQVIDWYKLDP